MDENRDKLPHAKLSVGSEGGTDKPGGAVAKTLVHSQPAGSRGKGGPDWPADRLLTHTKVQSWLRRHINSWRAPPPHAHTNTHAPGKNDGYL